jgi:dihydrofolate synthase/folylpolyglutamate synthase
VLTLVTPIGLDHQAFLGDTIEAIATTKLNAMANRVILGIQPYSEVNAIASTIAAQKGAALYHCEALLDEDGIIALQNVTKNRDLPHYLGENLMLAAAALTHLVIEFSAESFDAPLFGRLTKIAPNVLLDVGHNPLAAQAIAKTLANRKVILIYNSYGDKDYGAILDALRGNIERVELIEVTSERLASRRVLEEALNALKIPHGTFRGIAPEQEYLVFGSFSVAEAFLQRTGIK